MPFTRYTAFIVLYPIGIAPGESKQLPIITLLFNNIILIHSPFPVSHFTIASFFSIICLTVGHCCVVWLMYQALPFIKKKHLHEHLFNGLPFSYYNSLLVCWYLRRFFGETLSVSKKVEASIISLHSSISLRFVLLIGYKINISGGTSDYVGYNLLTWNEDDNLIGYLTYPPALAGTESKFMQ